MAYIIDESYFIRELVIPNTSEVDVGDTQNPFSNWIDTEARLMLQGALGFELFKDFDADVDAAGDYTGSQQRWLDLVDGAEYTFDGVLFNFPGLKFTQGTVPRSMMAYYVWAKWFTYHVSQVGGMGEQTGQSANSSIANGAARQSKAWNNFVTLYNGDTNIWQIVSGISFDRDVQNTHFVSLLKFLLHNESDYPDAALIVEEFKNRFSI